jgi:hypothetical protein
MLPVAGKVAPDFASSEVFDELLFLGAGLLSASFKAPAKVVPPALDPAELTDAPPDWDADGEAGAEVEGPDATGEDT